MIARLYSSDRQQLATVTIPSAGVVPPKLLIIPHTDEAGGNSFFFHDHDVDYIEVTSPDVCVLTLTDWPIQSGDTLEVTVPESGG